MADMKDIVQLPIFLAIAALLAGTIFLTGVGTFANGTQGSACTNCQATTTSMLNLTELGFPLALFLTIIGIAVTAIFAVSRRK